MSCGLRYLDDNEKLRLLCPYWNAEINVYTVPSFPVLSVELRKIKYQFILPDESIAVVDGFVHDDPSLKRTYPTELYVETSLKNACCVV